MERTRSAGSESRESLIRRILAGRRSYSVPAAVRCTSRTRAHARAAYHSSCVSIARIGGPVDSIRASCVRGASFAVASRAIPSRPSCRQMRARIGPARAPIPPVNTMASRRSSDADIAAIVIAARCANMSRAKAARSLPASAARSTIRRSLETPEMPRRPEASLSAASSSVATSVADVPAAPRSRIKYVSTLGSIAPERVPIIVPSSGVNPIDVSTLSPPRTAVTEQPPPRCATIRSHAETGRSSICAARSTQ